MRYTSKLFLALFLSTTALSLPTPQLHGEGEALDSIFTDTDNGLGYGIEDAEENIAANIASIRGGNAAGGTAAPPPPPTRRQLDKVANGLQAIGESLGQGKTTSGLTSSLESADGQLTDGAANIGADAGTLEEGLLIDTGKAVPRGRKR